MRNKTSLFTTLFLATSLVGASLSFAAGTPPTSPVHRTISAPVALHTYEHSAPSFAQEPVQVVQPLVSNMTLERFAKVRSDRLNAISLRAMPSSAYTQDALHSLYEFGKDKKAKYSFTLLGNKILQLDAGIKAQKSQLKLLKETFKAKSEDEKQAATSVWKKIKAFASRHLGADARDLRTKEKALQSSVKRLAKLNQKLEIRDKEARDPTLLAQVQEITSLIQKNSINTLTEPKTRFQAFCQSFGNTFKKVLRIRDFGDEQYPGSNLTRLMVAIGEGAGNNLIQAEAVNEKDKRTDYVFDKNNPAYKLAKASRFLNTQEKNGLTATHIAAEVDSADSIHLLARLGANLNAANNDGKTPLQLAREKGNTQAVRALLQEGAKSPIKNSVVEASPEAAAQLPVAKPVASIKKNWAKQFNLAPESSLSSKTSL